MNVAFEPALHHLTANDPAIGALIEYLPSPTFSAHTNYYQELVESVISQQLSVKAAATIRDRFVALFSPATFPDPSAILATSLDELRAVGLSRQKASYIQDLALKVIEGTVQFDTLDSLSNQEIIDELTRVKGVGVWTVHMFLIFCMGRLDVLPIGDLGVRKAIQNVYSLPDLPTPEYVSELAKKNGWHPYESVVSWYLWKSLDQPL